MKKYNFSFNNLFNNLLIFTKMKKNNFFKMVLPILAAVMLTAFKCGSGVEPALEITPVLIGDGTLYGAGREGFVRQNLIIRDNETWQNFINQMNSNNNVSETFTETEISFSEYMVIAVFDEVKGNGDWSIDITRIDNQANKIVVTVTNLSTGSTASVITQPFQIVKIPVSNKEIVFDITYKNAGE
jgi:hypothetical protein